MILLIITGDVWLIDLQDSRGHEQSGTRPGIVVSKSSGIVQVIPLTTVLERSEFPYTLVVYPDGKNGLDRSSIAMAFQIVSLDRERFVKRLGKISKNDLESIRFLLKELLKI